METPSRWVLLASVALSSFSVGLSLVAVGCHAATAEAAAPAPSARPAASQAKKAADPLRSRPETVNAEPARQRAQLVASEPRLEVARLVVSSDVLEREPVATTTLKAGQPVTAFVELKNAGSAGAVLVTFERADDAVGHVKLAVPASTSRYRTWATTRQISAPGTWHAVVRSASGQELARTSFDVAAAEAPSEAARS